jgi:hypothetical protein
VAQDADAGIVVTETGLAISYAGDVFVPAQGPETALEPMTGAEPAVINYYFPLEIVLVGDLSEETHQVIQTRIWENFGDALDRVV